MLPLSYNVPNYMALCFGIRRLLLASYKGSTLLQLGLALR